MSSFCSCPGRQVLWEEHPATGPAVLPHRVQWQQTHRCSHLVYTGRPGRMAWQGQQIPPTLQAMWSLQQCLNSTTCPDKRANKLAWLVCKNSTYKPGGHQTCLSAVVGTPGSQRYHARCCSAPYCPCHHSTLECQLSASKDKPTTTLSRSGLHTAHT